MSYSVLWRVILSLHNAIMAFEINNADIETGAKSSETNNILKGCRQSLFALAFMVAPTMFASAQTTGPEKKPEDKKPTTEQVAITPTDSNKVVTVLPPRPKRNLDKSTAWDDVVRQAQQEANIAKQALTIVNGKKE